MTIALWLVLLAAAVAAYTDARTQRIPHLIPLALVSTGAIASAFHGWLSLLVFVAIAIAVVLVGTVLFSLRLLGGGDVKLLAAAAATLGAHDAPLFLIATILCGGIFGLIFAAFHGKLRTTLRNLHAMLLPIAAGVRPALLAHGTKMPYGIAIFSGALATAAAHLAHARFIS